MTDVLSGADGPLPLLILDQRPEMTVRSGATEGVTRIATLLDQAAHAEELVGGLVEACC